MRRLSSIIGKSLLGAAVGALALGSVAQAQEMQEVNAMTPNSTSCSVYPQWNGTEFGYWPKSGLKVNLLDSETTVPYVAFLQNGDADIVMLDSAQVLQAADNDLPIKAVYEAYNFAPEGIIVPADSDIMGLADLVGTTIGMASDRDLITTIISMDSIGMTLDEANITTVVVGDSGPVMAGALRDGTVQAFAGAGSDRAAIRAAGIQIRNITPSAVSRNPGNTWTIWGPTAEEKREIIGKFLRGWAMAQHAGVVDTKLSASACRVLIPEQFENIENGLTMLRDAIYGTQLRRTKFYGELQPNVWAAIQGPYLKLNEINEFQDPEKFLDGSFTEAANDWTLDEVKAGMAEWKAAHPDDVIN